ncbi:hypothetical protein ACNKHU_12680 [Shigella flexneri]
MKIIRDDPAVVMSPALPAVHELTVGDVYHPPATRRTQRNGARNYRPSARKSGEGPGAKVFLMAVQDIRVGGRQSNASYQYTLLSDDLAALRERGPKIREKTGDVARNWRT